MKINVPEGYEIDKSRSTDNEIFFKKKEMPVLNKILAYISDMKGARYDELRVLGTLKMNTRTNAYHVLSCIAAYYNDGWEPDWDNGSQDKYFIREFNNGFIVDVRNRVQDGGIYFKNKDDAKEVISNPEFKQYIECLIL